MKLQNEQQVVNTQRKLEFLEQRIAAAQLRPATPERDESIGSLISMANQLREEIISYRSHEKLIQSQKV